MKKYILLIGFFLILSCIQNSKNLKFDVACNFEKLNSIMESSWVTSESRKGLENNVNSNQLDINNFNLASQRLTTKISRDDYSEYVLYEQYGCELLPCEGHISEIIFRKDKDLVRISIRSDLYKVNPSFSQNKGRDEKHEKEIMGKITKQINELKQKR